LLYSYCIVKSRFYFRFFVFILLLSSLALEVVAQDYATIFVYRKKKLIASGVFFKIYLNKLEIAQIPNGGRLEYRIYEAGRYNVMIGVFSEYMPIGDTYKSNVSLDVELGKNYYLRGIKKDVELVSEETGRDEFNRSTGYSGSIELIDNKPFDYDEYYAANKKADGLPKILITSPSLSTTQKNYENSSSITLQGVIGEGEKVNSITINGNAAIITGNNHFTAVIDLYPGENTINVVAKTKSNRTIEQRYVVIREDESLASSQTRGGGDPLKGLNISKATPKIVTGKYFAFIIGIDKYTGHWAPLQNAVNDAKAVESLLRSHYKFDEYITLFDYEATRTAILDKMEYMVNEIQSNDNLFIYYSGHGEFKQSLNKGYWVPIDSKKGSISEYISNSDIQTFLGGIKSKHTLLVSDACFSGDIFRGNTVTIPFENSGTYYSKVYNKKSRQAISSGGIEPVMDGGREGHSVFNYYILKALNDNREKYFDSSQLYENIKIPVINNSEQTPKFSPIKNTGDEGGHFIFIRKN